MTRPRLWLDIIVGACALAATLFGVATLREEPGPRRGRYKFLSTILFGSAFLLGSLDGIATSAIAPRLSFTGDILSLKSRGGKNRSCRIGMVDSQGSRAELKGNFGCEPLVVGQQVRATWRAFDARIMRLDILSGANAGSYINGDSLFEDVIWIGFGAFLIYVAFRVQRTNPNANPRPRMHGDPPSSAIDEDSMLNLHDEQSRRVDDV